MIKLRHCLALLLSLVTICHGLMYFAPARSLEQGQFSFTAGGAFTQHSADYLIGLGHLAVSHGLTDWLAVQVQGRTYVTNDETQYHEGGLYSVGYGLKASFSLAEIPLTFGGTIESGLRYDGNEPIEENRVANSYTAWQSWGSLFQYGPFYASVNVYTNKNRSQTPTTTFSVGIDYPLNDHLNIIVEGAFHAKDCPFLGVGVELTL